MFPFLCARAGNITLCLSLCPSAYKTSPLTQGGKQLILNKEMAPQGKGLGDSTFWPNIKRGEIRKLLQQLMLRIRYVDAIKH